MQFKISDLVRLKSGGPTMTIVGCKDVNSDDGDFALKSPVYKCKWYNGANFPEADFDERTLVGAFENPQQVQQVNPAYAGNHPVLNGPHNVVSHMSTL